MLFYKIKNIYSLYLSGVYSISLYHYLKINNQFIKQLKPNN